MIGDAFRPTSIGSEKARHGRKGHAVVALLRFAAVNSPGPACPGLDAEQGVSLDRQAGFAPAAFKDCLCYRQGREDPAFLHIRRGKCAHPLDEFLLFLCHVYSSVTAERCSGQRAFPPFPPGSPF